MDLLYKPFMRVNNYRLGYDFGDANLVSLWHPDSISRLRLSAFFNSDGLNMKERDFDLDMVLKWHNEAISLNYERRTRRTSISSDLYFSGFDSRLRIDIPGMESLLKSSIKSLGANYDMNIDFGHKKLRNAGLAVASELYRATPQTVEIKGPGDGVPKSVLTENALETRMALFADFSFGKNINLKATAAANLYCGPGGYVVCALLPSLMIENKVGEGVISISAAMNAQSLHQVGFSEIGLASNYWIMSTGNAPQERGTRFGVSWDSRLPWLGLSIASDIYFAVVRNLTEYSSGILETLSPVFSPTAGIEISKGWNSGISIEIRRNFGTINGKVGISYSEARRRSAGGGWYRGNYDDGLRLKATLDWHPGSHWILGATFNLASGRVYTPVKEIYLISSAIASEYGKRNSARLPMYQRLDLSATYVIPFRRRRHLINVSLLNAYGHKNFEMMYYRVDPKTMSYGLKKIYSVYRWLPSLSYTFEIK